MTRIIETIRLVVSDPTSSFILPTYAASFALFDSYQKNVTIEDTMTPELLAKELSLIDAVLNTEVMQITHTFLASKGLYYAVPSPARLSVNLEFLRPAGYVSTDVTEFRNLLSQIWFGRWAEQTPGVLSSSGYEHAALGERLTDNTLVGYHSWLYFYDEEGEGDGDYRGYIDVKRTATTTILSMPIFLYGSTKASSEFLFGASPELEFALGTLCFYARPNAICPISAGDDTLFNYDVHTIDYNGVTYIESAHPTFEV